MKITSILFCVLMLSSCVHRADMIDIPGETITLESLEEMFANIDKKTSWDMSGNMLWGYFLHTTNQRS